MTELDAADATRKVLGRWEHALAARDWIPDETDLALAARLHAVLGEVVGRLLRESRPDVMADPGTLPDSVGARLEAGIDDEAGPVAEMTQTVATYVASWMGPDSGQARNRQHILLLYGQLLAAVVRDDTSY